MPVLFSMFLSLIVLCLVFSLLYWMAVLASGLIPEPARPVFRTILLILLALMAIFCLLDMIGLFGPRHLLITMH